MDSKTALDGAEGTRPKDWDKWVSAAYLRILGATQEESARGVGRARRTIQLWEADKENWAAARAEAEDRWLANLKHASMKTILENVSAGNAVIGMQVAERLIPALAPPKHKVEHSGHIDLSNLTDDELRAIAES